MQNHFNLVLKQVVVEKRDIRIGLLPPERFPSGLFRTEWERVNAWRKIAGLEEKALEPGQPVVFHANYVYGREKKVIKLRKAGLWRVGWKEEGGGETAALRIKELKEKTVKYVTRLR